MGGTKSFDQDRDGARAATRERQDPRSRIGLRNFRKLDLDARAADHDTIH
jgi:hypothetical protein